MGCLTLARGACGAGAARSSTKVQGAAEGNFASVLTPLEHWRSAFARWAGGGANENLGLLSVLVREGVAGLVVRVDWG